MHTPTLQHVESASTIPTEQCYLETEWFQVYKFLSTQYQINTYRLATVSRNSADPLKKILFLYSMVIHQWYAACMHEFVCTIRVGNPKEIK